MPVTVAAATLLAGLMTGLTGVGGVLVVPALTELAQVSVERAVGASMLAFCIAGGVPAFVHLRRARLEARPVVVLCLGAVLGAAAGALTLGVLSPRAVRLFVALLAVASGIYALVPRPPAPPRAAPSAGLLALLGLGVGYASAISGTGGPVTLIPLLLMLGTPIGPAVALGVTAQMPITVTATLVNAAQGRIDFLLGALLGVLFLAGAAAGAWLSGRLSGRRLTAAVALTLLAVGAWYGYTGL